MTALMDFFTLLVTTLFATGVAVLLGWMLRLVLQCMRPATALRILAYASTSRDTTRDTARGSGRDTVRGLVRLTRAPVSPR